jgi:hypothetical protein
MIRKKQLKIELAAVLKANRLLHDTIAEQQTKISMLALEKADLLDACDYLTRVLDEVPEEAGPQTGDGRPNRKKLTKSEVEEIREMKRNGSTQSVLAEIFDVNPATISRIIRGQYHKK